MKRVSMRILDCTCHLYCIILFIGMAWASFMCPVLHAQMAPYHMETTAISLLDLAEFKMWILAHGMLQGGGRPRVRPIVEGVNAKLQQHLLAQGEQQPVHLCDESGLVAEHCKIVTANIDSLRRHSSELLQLAFDVAVVTEAKVNQQHLALWRDRYRKEQIAFHAFTSERSHANEGSGGVAVLVRHPYYAVQEEWLPVTEATRGRIILMRIMAPGGSLLFHIAGVYGYSEPESHREAQAELWEVLGKIVRTYRGSPLLITGDMNEEIGESPEFGSIMGAGALVDILSVYENPRMGTFTATPEQMAATPGRAIDHMLANPEAAARFVMAETAKTRVFPSHWHLYAEYVPSIITTGTWMRLPCRLPKLHESARPPDPGMSEELFDALHNHEVTLAWECWCATWEAYLRDWAERDTTTESDKGAQYWGRDKSWLVETPIRPPRRTHCASEPLALRQVRRSIDMLRGWINDFVVGATSFEALNALCQRWHRAHRRVQKLHGIGPVEDAYSACDMLQRAQTTIEALVVKRDELIKLQDISQAKQWRKDIATFSVAARHIRAAGFRDFYGIKDKDGKVITDIRKLDDMLVGAWTDISEPHANYDDAKVVDFIGSHVALHARWNVPRLEAEDFKRVLRAMRSQSSPGPGGWHPCDLSKLPMAAWQQLADIVELARLSGQNPTTWDDSWTCFLPKSDSIPCADQLRPLTIAPSIWRIVSGAFHGKIQSYLEERYADTQCGARVQRSTNDVVAEVRHYVDTQLHAGNEVYALQLDLRKAFNNMNVKHSLQIWRRWGLSDADSRWLSAHYDAVTTVIRYPLCRAGSKWNTTRGIPQGEALGPALANTLLSLLAHQLTQQCPGVAIPLLPG